MTHENAAAFVARLSDSYPYRHRAERLRTLRLDDGRTVQYPGPRLVARAVGMLPNVAALRRRGMGLADPRADRSVALSDVAETAHEFVTTLPDRASARRPYNDLRAFAASADPRAVAAYFDEVARQIRTLTPRESTALSPQELAERAEVRALARQAAAAEKAAERAAREAERATRAALSAEDRAAERREADRARFAERRATSCDLAAQNLHRWVARLNPGRYALTDLWDQWCTAVARMDPCPARDALEGVGRTTFYRLLAASSDVRPGHARTRVLVVPPVGTLDAPQAPTRPAASGDSDPE